MHTNCSFIEQLQSNYNGDRAHYKSETGYQYLAHDQAASLHIDNTDSATGQFLAGLFAADAGATDSANMLLGDALSGDPNSNLLLNKGLLVALEASDFNQAYRLASRLHQKDNTHVLSAIVLAHQALTNQKFKDAKDLLLPHKNNTSLGPTLPLLLGWSFAGQGHLDAAERSLTLLSKSYTFKPIYYNHQALFARLFGNNTKVKEYFLTSLEYAKLPRTMQLIGQHLILNISKKNLNTAPISFEKILADTTVQKKPYSAIEGFSDALHDMALFFVENNSPKSALIFAQMALKLTPNNHLKKLYVASMLSKKGDYDHALALLYSIPKKNVLFATAQVQIAENLNKNGDHKAALQLLEELAAQNIEPKKTLPFLADLLRYDQQYEAALDIYNKAMPYFAGSELKWLILYHRGISYEKLGQWENAEADLVKALELFPDQPDVLNYLGYSWIERGYKVEEGQKLIERAVELDPDNGYIIDSLGWSFFKRGNFTKAIFYLERAVELIPHDPVITDHLADAYWGDDRRNEAKFQWQRALDLNPEDELREKIEQKISHGITPADHTKNGL